MPLQPGDTLERYVIEGVLGEGGMGLVYRARDLRLNRRVALKVLHDSAVPGAGFATEGSARILREARTAAMLEHPNVVATYDVGEIVEGPHAGTAYLAMEFVDGRSLRGFVGDTSVPIVTRVRWLSDVARGLHAAHERALVHRDMKPENVIVRTDGTVKVLDFGIAKHSFVPVSGASGAAIEVRTVTGEGVVVGTPLYMAPEQMRGSHVDAKADQFAWGVVTYELLTGVRPWGNKLDAIALVAAVLGETPADPRTVNKDIPAWLATVVLRTLSKDPQARYPTMRDVVAALDTGEIATAPTEALPIESLRGPASLETPPSAPPPQAPVVEARTGAIPRRAWTRTIALSAAVIVAAGAGTALLRGRPPASGSTAQGDSAAPHAGSLASPRDCSRAACAQSLGAPAACRASDGACVPLASPDCVVHADDAAASSDDTLWIGGLYPLTGDRAARGTIAEQGADLARIEIAGAFSALRAGGGHARPVGLVACDATADVQRAARHLVEDVGVPAIVDAQGSQPLVELVSAELAPHQVLDLATAADGPIVTQIPHAPNTPPPVWRTTINGGTGAAALARLVESKLEPQLRSQGVARMRVAVVRTSDPANRAIAERFFDTLHFNGKSALENGADFTQFTVDEKGDADATYADDVARVRAFAPHVILALGSAVTLHVVPGIEHATPPAQPRPWYLTTSLFADRLVGRIGHDRSFRQRFFGIGPTATTAVNARFTMHYNEVFKADLTRSEAPGTDYDAFYVLAFASYALGEQPPTGPNLASAIKHLVPPGAPLDVGPSGIFAAFTALSSGKSIDLSGASGNLDFDLATGEPQGDLAVLCVEPDASGAARDAVESGLVYAAKTGELTGRLHCP